MILSKENLKEKLVAGGIPPHMHEGIIEYVFEGRPPGDFLMAIFKNDFVQAAGRGDFANQKSLLEYASMLYNYIPCAAWGSSEQVVEWIAKEGLNGAMRKAAREAEEEKKKRKKEEKKRLDS